MSLFEQCVILNPNAGTADQLSLLEGLKQLGAVGLFTVQGPGHATEVARQAVREGFKRVIAAGGDGTLNEVINGLVDGFGKIELGLIPMGTGNDFARSVFIPPDPAQAVAILNANQIRTVDVVRVDSGTPPSRYFINVSAGGFSSVVDEKLEKGSKDLLGTLAYAWSAIKALPELVEHSLRVVFDDDEVVEMSAYNIVVANGCYVAGGIPVAPSARLDDGLLDVMIFRAMPLSKMALMLPSVMAGEHLEDEDVLFRHARKVHITADPPFEFNTDGEVSGQSPVTFEVVPQALHVVVGAPPAEQAEAT